MTDLLTVEDIMARYRMADDDTARRYMRKLPCIKIGKRLFVRADDVAEWERKNTIYPVIRIAKKRRTV